MKTFSNPQNQIFASTEQKLRATQTNLSVLSKTYQTAMERE